MQYRKNLEFQQQHFPKVYRQYFEAEPNEGERPIEIAGDEKIRDEVIIVCKDYKEILDLFRIPYALRKNLPKELEDYAVIRIESAYTEKIQDITSQRELQLQYFHGYHPGCRRLFLVKSPSKAIVQNAAKIIIMTELDFFASRWIRDYDSFTITGGVEELRKTLLELKLGYDETKFLTRQLSSDSMEESQHLRFIENRLDTVLSLDICTVLSELLQKRPVSHEDCLMILHKYTEEYEKMTLEFLREFIVNADFTKNFWLVNGYFEQQKAFEKEATHFISGSLVGSFTHIWEQFVKEAQSTDLYLALLESNIEELDVILRKYLEQFYEQMQVLLGR